MKLVINIFIGLFVLVSVIEAIQCGQRIFSMCGWTDASQFSALCFAMGVALGRIIEYYVKKKESNNIKNKKV